MKLSLRFALDNLFVLGAAFLAVSAMAFSAPVAGWLAFGVSAGLLLLAMASLGTARRAGQRIGHGLVGLAALWSLIAALIFTGPALTWLVLADAIALGVLAQHVGQVARVGVRAVAGPGQPFAVDEIVEILHGRDLVALLITAGRAWRSMRQALRTRRTSDR